MKTKPCRLRCVVCLWFSNKLKCMVSCLCFSCQQPQQVPKVSSLWCLSNVGKGSRQIGSVTSGQGLALRTGPVGLGCEAGLELARAGRGREAKLGTCWGRSRGPPQLRGANSASAGCSPSAGIQRSAQNWYGPGESDCLIKTKHCDGRHLVLTQCDFCPVL